jgi:ATP-dependent Lhr-like helicase
MSHSTGFDLLSLPIQKFIYDRGWQRLSSIQAAAISKIMGGNENLILVSPTASGKTEAAFLPILSKIDCREAGVQVLYISPLIALINDQFERMEELCKYLNAKVTKWHSEASRAEKRKLTLRPEGIVIITPESLEAMLATASLRAKTLFSRLKYIVIDEVHSFLGADRGIQLKSILARLQRLNEKKAIVIGLSATISDFDEAKKMTGEPNNTKILIDKTQKEIETYFAYIEGEMAELPTALLHELYLRTQDKKVLIFPNTRGRVEEIAVKLKMIAQRANGHMRYFAHHASVEKEERESIEKFAKNNVSLPFCIACTSTLELGIDIGSVEAVVQIDSTYSVASLIQRVGRSGRREGQKGVLYLYATNPWCLLQGLACRLLYQENFVEPSPTSEKAYDILFHQILALVKQYSELKPDALVEILLQNYAFAKVTKENIQIIIRELVSNQILEILNNVLIIGVEGEKIVNSREFYSVFQRENNFNVKTYEGRRIGEIAEPTQAYLNENIYLAARVWKINDIDFQSRTVFVKPATDGKPPLFMGSGGTTHPKVREKMLLILITPEYYPFLEESAIIALNTLRKDFERFSIKPENISTYRPVIFKEDKVQIYTFTGTKLNRSIAFVLEQLQIDFSYLEYQSSFNITIKPEDFGDLLLKMQATLLEIDRFLERAVEAKPFLLDFSKWGSYLPKPLKIEILKDRYFDFPALSHFLQTVQFVASN